MRVETDCQTLKLAHYQENISLTQTSEKQKAPGSQRTSEPLPKKSAPSGWRSSRSVCFYAEVQNARNSVVQHPGAAFHGTANIRLGEWTVHHGVKRRDFDRGLFQYRIGDRIIPERGKHSQPTLHGNRQSSIRSPPAADSRLLNRVTDGPAACHHECRAFPLTFADRSRHGIPH